MRRGTKKGHFRELNIMRGDALASIGSFILSFFLYTVYGLSEFH